MTTTTPPAANELERQTHNHRLPIWARLWLWAIANADHHGHARAYPGQLRRALGDTSAREVSRAIRLAKDRRLIDPCSTASCVVMPGHRLAPCEAQHRGDA